MNSAADHLIIAPVVLPLVVGAALLLVSERRRTLKAVLSVVSALTLIFIAMILVAKVGAPTASVSTASMGVYHLGDWPAPYGIVLVLDRLSALMLLLTSILAAASVVFSMARWDRAGAHFHSLVQFLLMGLNGAFLTGDLFNLFVFFEVLLASSYGLALHGSGARRVGAGLHYIAVNLLASLLFLIGVSLIYGASGTLNMADLAARIAVIDPDRRGLLHAGAAILGVAFFLKAGMWPLCFWLPSTYAAAAAPVTAIFTIMTKVGVYVVLRLSLLLFAGQAEIVQFGEWIFWVGIATVVFGLVGTLASQHLARVGAYLVIVSSGTVLAATGMGHVEISGAALFYLVSSTLGLSAFFLLIELIERGREPGADVLALTREAYEADEALEEEDREVGLAVPATMGVLGLSFMGCALVIAGLPPLSGFVAKFAVLSAALNTAGLGSDGTVSARTWTLLAVLILSGLTAVLSMTRTGIRALWASPDRSVPRVRVIEIAPVIFLLFLCAVQTVQAGPILRYMRATAEALHAPQNYVAATLAQHANRWEGRP